MSYLQAIILGILQGITEFLPVSSSGHLAVVERFMNLGVSPQALEAFDVMVHVATLAAVIMVFRKAIVEVFTSRRRLIPLYIVGCIPAGSAGVLLKMYGQDTFDSFKGSLTCIGTAFIATGVILLLTRFIGKSRRDDETVTLNDAIRIGVYQAAALLPGISRSGVTIGAGVMGGLTRSFAAQFSFIMAIPLILGAAVVDAKHLVVDCPIAPGVLAAGFIAAFATGLLALFGLVAIVKRGKLWVFSLYLLPLGIALICYTLFAGPAKKPYVHYDNPAVVKLLEELKSPDKDMRAKVLINLDLPSREHIPEEVIKHLEGDDSDMSYAAAVGMGRLGDERALPYLLRIVIEDDYERYGSFEDVISALKEISEPAVQPLIGLLENSDAENTAIEALGQIGKAAVKPLIAALNPRNHQSVVGNAADALGKIGDKTAVPYLIKLLPSEDQFIRCNSVVALGKIADTEAKKPLEKMLNDEDANVRAIVAEALGALKPPAIDSLIMALESSHDEVRHGSLRELWRLKPKKAVGPLVRMLGSPKKMPNTDYCLRMITGQDFGEDYKKWKEWYEKNRHLYEE